MTIQTIQESSLITSEIFKGLDNIGKVSIRDRAVNLIKNSKHLNQADIEIPYISIKTITDTLTRASLKAYDNGKIVLLYNDTPSLSMSQALPFITFKSNNEYVTYVFMDKYITKNKDGVINIQSVILRDILQGALIANSLKYNYEKLTSNQYLQKILMTLYTKFVMRIINKEFAVSSDKITNDTLYYWINRFFLTRIFGTPESQSNIESMATSHFKFIDETKYNEIKQQYEDADPIEISNLLELLKTANTRMKSLGLGMFISSWINYYYMPSMLAIDNIEYLIYMIIVLFSGNNIISVSAAEMVRSEKNIKAFKTELLKLI